MLDKYNVKSLTLLLNTAKVTKNSRWVKFLSNFE